MSRPTWCFFKYRVSRRNDLTTKFTLSYNLYHTFQNGRNFIHPIQRLNRLIMLSEIFEYLYFCFPSPFYPFKATFLFRKLLGMTGDDLGRLREYECILQTTRATESHAGEDDDYHIPNGQSDMAEFPTGR